MDPVYLLVKMCPIYIQAMFVTGYETIIMGA